MSGCYGCGGESMQDVIAEIAGDRSGPARWLWRSIHKSAEARVERILHSWVGTDYQNGRRERGIGVDCRELMAAAWDSLYRLDEPTELPVVPFDAAINHTGVAAAALRVMIRQYQMIDVTAEGVIEPGDGICHRTRRDSTREVEAHASIAGVLPQTVYHAPHSRAKVCRSSLGGMPEIVAVYRPKDKNRWI